MVSLKNSLTSTHVSKNFHLLKFYFATVFELNLDCFNQEDKKSNTLKFLSHITKIYKSIS